MATDIEVVADVQEATAVESMTRGEVETQISAAKRWPRSLVTFKARALEMATLDQETAESCIYALPRDGKTIEGPSVRLAEILASAYGHLRVEGRPVADDGKMVTSRGTAWDIQNNVLIAFETKRRVTDKHGKRYKDDMVGVTANAGTSIAIRNAVLKVIPKAFWGPIYEACRKTAVGDSRTLANRRAAMLDYFVKLGATNEKVFALLGIKGVEDITLEHMATLTGLRTAIKDGDTTVDEAFAPPQPAAATTVQRASKAATPTPPPLPADGPTLPGLAHSVEEDDRGHYWLTLTTGERLAVDDAVADIAELLKFCGTDHRLLLYCVKNADESLTVKAFTVAD